MILRWLLCALALSSGTLLADLKRSALQPRTPERRLHSASSLTCSGKQQETASCNIEACAESLHCTPVEAVWGYWSGWGPCSCSAVQERHRIVEQHAFCGGTQLEGPSSQARGCDPICDDMFPRDCVFSAWSPWGQCDKKCEGGQRSRTRELTSPHENCGAPCEGPLEETEVCNEQKCEDKMDCAFTDWGLWSECSVTCGGGQQSRDRESMDASKDGEGCEGFLKQTRGCNSFCCDGVEPADCKWHDWDDWSICSASCDGGYKMRQREQASIATHGGEQCDPADLVEASPCNQQACDTVAPMDAVWGDWSAWTASEGTFAADCTVTCGGGYQYRSRAVAQAAMEGGNPVTGPMQQFQACNTEPCATGTDCALGGWEDWSDCTAQVNGQRSRTRQIAIYADQGGMPCEGTMKETDPCNNAPEDFVIDGELVQGVVSEWEDWTACSKSCDGGSKTRSRSIIDPGMLPKHLAIQESVGCNRILCDAEFAGDQDCVWGQWTDWSGCPVTCGGGEKSRYRNVETMSRNSGKPCTTENSYEVAKCGDESCFEPLFCVWGDWTPYSQCSVTCGGGRKTRVRSLATTGVRPEEDEGYFSTTQLVEARDLAESRLALADTALLGLAALAVVALVRGMRGGSMRSTE